MHFMSFPPCSQHAFKILKRFIMWSTLSSKFKLFLGLKRARSVNAHSLSSNTLTNLFLSLWLSTAHSFCPLSIHTPSVKVQLEEAADQQQSRSAAVWNQARYWTGEKETKPGRESSVREQEGLEPQRERSTKLTAALLVTSTWTLLRCSGFILHTRAGKKNYLLCVHFVFLSFCHWRFFNPFHVKPHVTCWLSCRQFQGFCLCLCRSRVIRPEPFH